MFQIRSELLKTDVTAVKILGDQILTGIGNNLLVFHKVTHLLQASHQIPSFEGCKIHGFEVNETRSDPLSNDIVAYSKKGEYYTLELQQLLNPPSHLMLYAGKRAAVYFSRNTFSTLDLAKSVTLQDWILTAQFLNTGDIAVMFKHNTIAVYSFKFEKKHEVLCEDRCVLYSAFICNNTWEDLVVLSGTVCSEVLVWRPVRSVRQMQGQFCETSVRLKGHQGVIFSLHYNETSGYITSSSDDRSTILWSVRHKDIVEELEQPEACIVRKCRVYGHQSRVFCSKVTDQFFVTAGEDSLINVWNFDGDLLRTFKTHQGGCVWTLDCDEKFIVSGGGDCGVTLYRVKAALEEGVLFLSGLDPKHVRIFSWGLLVFTAHGQMLSCSGDSSSPEEWSLVAEHEDLESYSVVEVSKCGKLLALGGFRGQLYVYRECENTLQLWTSHVSADRSRIFSIHWLTCCSLLTCGSAGRLSLLALNSKDKSLGLVASFILPESSERWSTAACQDKCGYYIVGDRKGNVYVYKLSSPEPIQVLKREHSHLGVTGLYNNSGAIMSLGRNSLLKTYKRDEVSGKVVCVTTNKVPFSWLVGAVEGLLLGFSGKNFVVWDLRRKRIVFEVDCGGGHRSWDFRKTSDGLLFAYLKDSVVRKVKCDMNTIFPVDLVCGYHSREINCARAVEMHGRRNGHSYLVVSGSEDTELRVSVISKSRFETVGSFKTHLSSIRTLCIADLTDPYDRDETWKDPYLVFSGGGRAQIICWKLVIHYPSGVIQFNEVCSYHEKLSSSESEMRIMDLTTRKRAACIELFAACSDGNIKMFSIDSCFSDSFQLTFIGNMFYKPVCILKVICVEPPWDSVLISVATDGCVVFWDIASENVIASPQSFSIHQSGINSSSHILKDWDSLLFLTGGDDNCVALSLFKASVCEEENVLAQVSQWKNTGTHCAQVTSVSICKNYFLTASIDQRLAIFRWSCLDDQLQCELLQVYNTSVADVKEVECFNFFSPEEAFNLFVYGKGVEFVEGNESNESSIIAKKKSLFDLLL